EQENRAYRDRLEQTVVERTAKLHSALARLHDYHEETIRRLAVAAEFRDVDTGRHIERIGLVCALLGRRIGLTPERVEALPLEARIVAVADVFDALTNQRVYRKPYAADDAVALLEEGRGTQFDPEVLDVFLGSLDEVLEIAGRVPEPVLAA